jgi:hypothetical protein
VPNAGDADQGDATVTAPAGAAPPLPTLRVPKHGKGLLLTAGMPGNKGGTGHPAKVREKLVLLGDQTVDELLARMADEKLRAKMSVDTLRLILDAVLPYFLARRLEHSGPEGAPIPIEAVENTVAEKLRQRLHTRELLLHPPGSEPATPPAEPPGVVSRTL